MTDPGKFSFKVCLLTSDPKKPEIKRFEVQRTAVNYLFLISKLYECFPLLPSETFTLYWIDEDGDEVSVSTDSDLSVALNSMLVKKFYVRPNSIDASTAIHPGVECDQCEQLVAGIRYKCVVCYNYDLCKSCEASGAHGNHPMLKIPNPDCFNKVNPQMLGQCPESYDSRHHKQHRHSHEDGKKKKRSDRRESSRETGDESEEGCHKKHKKCKKTNACPYSIMMSDVCKYFNPVHFRPQCPASQGAQTHFPQASYLRSVGSTLQKLLDPLGVNVEFEVRPKEQEKEGEKKQEKDGEKKQEKDGEKKQEKENQTPSAPPQREVRFVIPAPECGTIKQRVDEITNILAGQSMSKGSSPEHEGWVSFEELRKDWEEPRPSTSANNIPKESQKEQNNGGNTKESAPLYPNLNSVPEHPNPQVRESLRHMLSMGFTNDGNWLTTLLEAKNGDLEATLETLSPFKKN